MKLFLNKSGAKVLLFFDICKKNITFLQIVAEKLVYVENL